MLLGSSGCPFQEGRLDRVCLVSSSLFCAAQHVHAVSSCEFIHAFWGHVKHATTNSRLREKGDKQRIRAMVLEWGCLRFSVRLLESQRVSTKADSVSAKTDPR